MTESQQIQALRAQYQASLLEKSKTASAWAQTLELNAQLDDVGVELEAWLHKIAGSAGMYGYQNIAQKARELMARLASKNSLGAEISRELAQLSDMMAAHSGFANPYPTNPQ